MHINSKLYTTQANFNNLQSTIHSDIRIINKKINSKTQAGYKDYKRNV